MALTPLDFPPSPVNGQTHPNPPVTGQPTYQWDAASATWLSKFALGKEFVPLDGSAAMTGLLTLSGDPTAPLHAATKQYTDAGLLRSNYAKKNYIINGAMMVSQENGAAAGNVTGYYPVDQFSVNFFGMAGVINMAQMTSSPSPAGSPNRLWTIVATPDAAVAAGDLVYISYPIEGLRAADLSFGSAAAKTITIQFGVKAPSGTYCVAVLNKGSTRAYVAEYVIAAGEANTSVVKSVTIPGDVTGTWVKDNTIGLNVCWCLMAGATYQTPAGVWGTANALGSPNQFNFMGTLNNTFELFDVSLTEGSVAPPFQLPDYASELALCQRYYYKTFFTANEIITTLQAVNATSGNAPLWRHPVTMRSGPSALPSSPANFSAQPASGGNLAVSALTMIATVDRAYISSTTYASGTVGGNAVSYFANVGNAWISMNARL